MTMTRPLHPRSHGLLKQAAAAAFILCVAMLQSCGAASEFQSLREKDSVEIIHIPRAMGWMAGKFISAGDSEAGRMLKGFKSLDVVECGRNTDRADIRRCIDKVLKNDRGELLLDIAENKERTTIYGRPDLKSKKIHDILIVTEEKGQVSLIRAKGSFDINDLVSGKFSEKRP